MKGRMFDVVAYITRQYGPDGGDVEDPQGLRNELLDAGFEEDDVERALAWLRRLRRRGAGAPPSPAPGHAIRLPTPEEGRKLSPAARGLLLRLERGGLIDPPMREKVYERALTLDEPELGVEELRVLVALLLKATPGCDDRVVERLLAGDVEGIYH